MNHFEADLRGLISGFQPIRSAIVVGAAAVLALLVGPLLGQWLRRATPKHELEVRGVLRGLRGLVLLVGIYEAVMILTPGVVRSGLGGLLFVAAAWIGARLALQVLSLLWGDYFGRHAGQPQGERAQREYLPVANMLTTVAVALLAVSLVAHHFGHDVTSLVTAFGVGSLAIGLAAQQTLGNMVAGFTLLVDRPFVPGDPIRLQSGETGEVMEVGIRSTRLALSDGSRMIVPNAELANTRIVNRSFAPRAEARLVVPWGIDIDDLSARLVEAMRALGGVHGDPQVLVTKIEHDGAEVLVRAHIDVLRERDTVEELMRRAAVRCVSYERAKAARAEK